MFGSVNNQMRIAREEIFGPVVCAIPFDDLPDAIAKGNDSAFGLAAYGLAIFAKPTKPLLLSRPVLSGLIATTRSTMRRPGVDSSKAVGAARRGPMVSTTSRKSSQ